MEKWLIVGLGNPGLRYRNTRHNIGWKAVDKLAKKLNVRIKKTSCGAKIIREDALGKSLILAKPLSFMNLSGKPVLCLMNANEIAANKIIVICDDIDLPAGVIRIRKKGSSGGQKGINSIISEIGTSDFLRVKIGIGRPDDGDVVDYVLRNPTKNDEQLLSEATENAVAAIKMILESGFDKAASMFNARKQTQNGEQENE